MKKIKYQTAILLFGSLRKGGGYFPPSIVFDLIGPATLGDILKQLGLPQDRVQLAMVNHRAVYPDHVIQPGDRVALFPKEYAFFADWENFRSIKPIEP